MRPEKPDSVPNAAGQGSNRPLRRGVIVFLVSAALIAAACYLFGWWSVASLGTGYIYGAVFLAIFGLCMAAGNSMPLQLSHVKDVTSRNGSVEDAPPDKPGPAQKGAAFLITTLIGAALLGLTGLLIKVLSGR